MDPLMFRQESPITRQGRRIVPGLILKAGPEGPKEPAGSQMSLPGMGGTPKVAAPAAPKPAAAISTPKPTATPAAPKPTATPAAPKPTATPAAPKSVTSPHQAAYEDHKAKTAFHTQQSSAASAQGNEKLADQHDAAAQAHFDASEHHRNLHQSHVSALHVGMSGAEADTSHGKELSQRAHALSSIAEGKSVSPHAVAAEDHIAKREGHMQQAAEARDSGNMKLAKQHTEAARAHGAARNIHTQLHAGTGGDVAAADAASQKAHSLSSAFGKTQPGSPPSSTPGEKVIPGAESKPSSKPSTQYGKPMKQAARPGQQMTLPGVAVHQQAMRAGAGHQLELPGGAAMHTRTGKEKAPKAGETIGQHEAKRTAAAKENIAAADVANIRRQQTFGKNPKKITRPGEMQDLHSAATAQPMKAEGGQMLLPGMSAANRKAQSQAAQKLQIKQSEQARENVPSGQQLEFGSHITKEAGPKTEAARVGQAMRGTPEQRKEAIKQSAANLRQTAEASGRQKGAAKPSFTPSVDSGKKGQEHIDAQKHHGNLSNYHTKMAAYHESQFNKTGNREHLGAMTAHKKAADSHKTAGTSAGNRSGMADDHKLSAYQATHKAEKFSEGSGVRTGLSEHAGSPSARESKAGVAGGEVGAAGRSTGGAGISTGGEGRTSGGRMAGSGKRSSEGYSAPSHVADHHNSKADEHEKLYRKTGNPDHLAAARAHAKAAKGGNDRLHSMSLSDKAERLSSKAHGKGKPGVAGPNIAGRYAAGYGQGLAIGSIGGPAFQAAQLTQQAMGGIHGIAQHRADPRKQQAQDAVNAMHQRQQQLQELHQVANKAMVESTPITRTGTRRVG